MLGDDVEGGVEWVKTLVWVASSGKGGHGSVSSGVDR
jgi:hypothetical protein